MDTESFEATGDGPVTDLRADGLHTEIGLGGVRRGVWEIRGSQLRRLEISVDAQEAAAEAAARGGTAKRSSESKKAADRLVSQRSGAAGYRRARAGGEGDSRSRPAVASGMSVHAEKAGGEGRLSGGDRRRDAAPAIRAGPGTPAGPRPLRYQDGQVFLTDATVAAWDNGRIQGSRRVGHGSRGDSRSRAM